MCPATVRAGPAGTPCEDVVATRPQALGPGAIGPQCHAGAGGPRAARRDVPRRVAPLREGCRDAPGSSVVTGPSAAAAGETARRASAHAAPAGRPHVSAEARDYPVARYLLPARTRMVVLLLDVAHLDDAPLDLRERAVAAVGGQPVRAAHGRRGVPALRPELALAVAPELARRSSPPSAARRCSSCASGRR